MAKLRRAFDLYFNYYVRRRVPTIVYSVERSGTVALFNSLVAGGVFSLATHYLDHEKISKGYLSGSARWASTHVIRKRKKARIISLVRSPVENMVSIFARSDFAPNAAERNDTRKLDAKALSQRFLTDYFETERYLHPLQWFDTEFKVALGVDVYSYPFDKDNGYVRFREGVYDILVLRTEMEAAQKSEVVGDFLDREDFKMLSSTSIFKETPDMASGRPGEQAVYGEQYKVLKRHATVPEKYLDLIIHSRYAQHFFTQDSLIRMKQRFLCPSSEV